MLQDQPEGHRTLYRCDDCIGGGLRCCGCLLSSHAERPLDRITAWDETARVWMPETFANLGFELPLGHAGTRCPNSRSSRLTTIVHDRGIVALPIRYCRCSGAQTEPLQLIAGGFWPATWKTPRTAMTLGVMDTYHMIARQAQVSVDDYVRHLARLTDNVLPTDVAVSSTILAVSVPLMMSRIVIGSSTTRRGSTTTLDAVRSTTFWWGTSWRTASCASCVPPARSLTSTCEKGGKNGSLSTGKY